MLPAISLLPAGTPGRDGGDTDMQKKMTSWGREQCHTGRCEPTILRRRHVRLSASLLPQNSAPPVSGGGAGVVMSPPVCATQAQPRTRFRWKRTFTTNTQLLNSLDFPEKEVAIRNPPGTCVDVGTLLTRTQLICLCRFLAACMREEDCSNAMRDRLARHRSAFQYPLLVFEKRRDRL